MVCFRGIEGFFFTRWRMEEQGVRRSEQVVFLVVDDYVIRYARSYKKRGTRLPSVCVCE